MKSFIGLGAVSVYPANAWSVARSGLPATFIMPEERGLHARTWMAFVADEAIWSRQQIPEVKRNLMTMATTIAKYEPVSMLVRSNDYPDALQRLKQYRTRFPVTLLEFEMDDLWLRDTGPTFIHSMKGKRYAIDFNFNGWGEKQAYARDARVARFITRRSGALPVTTELVIEGGAFEVDGQGTAMLTKSAVLNDNRNPGWSRHDVEEELSYLLGLKKIIWLEGIQGKDITDAHIDFYARFIQPGEVLVSRENDDASYDYDVTRENIRILSQQTDARGRHLKLTVMDNPETFNTQFGSRDFAPGYMGYYVCNGAVIMQQFGDAYADRQARGILEQAFPNHVIEQIAIDGIASGGGSIHCATQQEIALAGP